MTLLTTQGLRNEEDDAVSATPLESSFSNGDGRALEDVYNKHSALVYSLCRRATDEATAGDITQEVFLAAWRNRARYDATRGGLGPWLAGITRNKIIDHFRSASREDRRVERVKSVAFPLEPSEQELEDIALRMLLVDAMEELPERPRFVLALAFFEDLTQVEISARTGIPLGTVKSDIRRSLDRLRHLLRYRHG